MVASLPPILSIAGSDCSAGAGIQADLKAISAFGGYALTALTSVVSETPGKVSMIRLLDASFIADEIRLLLEAFPVRAAKTGMLGAVTQVQAVVETWSRHGQGIPLVVDPVMVATSGGRLLEDEAVQAIRDKLLPLATLITPNMDEARVLWGAEVDTREAMQRCACDLAQRFGTSVLVKGGHLRDDRADDVLCTAQGVSWLEAPGRPVFTLTAQDAPTRRPSPRASAPACLCWTPCIRPSSLSAGRSPNISPGLMGRASFMLSIT